MKGKAGKGKGSGEKGSQGKGSTSSSVGVKGGTGSKGGKGSKGAKGKGGKGMKGGKGSGTAVEDIYDEPLDDEVVDQVEEEELAEALRASIKVKIEGDEEDDEENRELQKKWEELSNLQATIRLFPTDSPELANLQAQEDELHHMLGLDALPRPKSQPGKPSESGSSPSSVTTQPVTTEAPAEDPSKLTEKEHHVVLQAAQQFDLDIDDVVKIQQQRRDAKGAAYIDLAELVHAVIEYKETMADAALARALQEDGDQSPDLAIPAFDELESKATGKASGKTAGEQDRFRMPGSAAFREAPTQRLPGGPHTRARDHDQFDAGFADDGDWKEQQKRGNDLTNELSSQQHRWYAATTPPTVTSKRADCGRAAAGIGRVATHRHSSSHQGNNNNSNGNNKASGAPSNHHSRRQIS